MSRVVDLLVELKAKSIAVSVEGDQLLVTAPPGVITPDIREQVRALKPEIVRLLANTPVDALAPPPAEPWPRGRTLSRPQSAIWLLEQVNPGTSVWNVPLVFDIRGALDRSILEESVRALLERHPALRSLFSASDGDPQVETVPLGAWQIDYADLRGDPDADQVAARLAKADADRPFDLSAGLLCRSKLMRTGDDAYVLVLVFHHIVVDGWSLGVILDQLSRLYDARLRGEADPLPPPRADYQAFVRQEPGKEAETQADLDWWCRNLSGDLPVTSLAPDRSRPHRGKARRLPLDIDAEMTARLEALAKQHAATPFMVLFAAFNLLAHRYTGETDLLIATPVSGRDRPEFADVVGMFVNTLAVRTRVDSELTFAELLGRVRATVLEAFARQNVSFDRVVEAVRPPRQHGETPLTPLSFAYQSMRMPELRLGAAAVTPRPIDFAGSRYDLSVEVWKTRAGLSCQFEYATELFDEDSVRRMMGHFRTLLAGALSDPQLRVSDLPLLTDAEQRHLLKNLNDTRASYDADRRIEALFADQAAATPDAPAIVHNGRILSYRALDERANQFAHRFLAADVGPGVIVGVCLERSPDLIAAILGILKAGGAYLPLDPGYPAQRLAFMLEDSAAPVLVTRSALGLGSAFPGTVIDLDAEREAVAQQPLASPDIRASADDLAYVIYTSGSTGRPKGTLLRHSATFLIDWARRTFSEGELARSVASTSICFDFSVFEIFVPLCTGGAVLLANDPLDPPDPESRPTAISAVPSVLAESLRRGAIPDSVRVIFAGGEVLTNRLVQSVYETTKVERIYNGYGPTECTTFATMALAPRGAAREPPIGRPLSNVQVYVLDAQRQLLPFGVAGELYIAGDGLARGYLNRQA
ncbi:MAG: AMP-binding protein, partial [Acetobacteraceae bacterium]|nr:AMP-binding protein [Acetobacteraceae bacterium]